MIIGGERFTRRGLLAGGAAGLVAFGVSACAPVPTNEFANLGRGLEDVMLASSAGASVRWGDLAGAPRALFFGFTRCPVICPVTIYELTAAADRIGEPVVELRIDFVTVDPDRDTPERMAQYFGGFGPKVTGFTGSEEALARLREAFDVSAARVPLDSGDYTMDHTATVFLIGRNGRVADVIAYGAAQDVLDQRLRALVSR
jgi:protein SCO1/2